MKRKTENVMQIDWKYLATTKGYQSLKAAYISDVQEATKDSHPMRKKEELLRHFQWVINRAKHYAHHTGEPMQVILKRWEEKRSYWWLNYYQDCSQPKFTSKSIKQMSVNGIRKQYRNNFFYSKGDSKKKC